MAMRLEGDDGERPAHATLVSARCVDGRVRIVIERARRTGKSWEAWSPLIAREYADWAAVPDADVYAIGAMVLANLEATMSETDPESGPGSECMDEQP